MYPSIVRTLVPVVVGVLLAQAAKAGLDLPGGVVTEAVTVVAATAYYAVARLVETHMPSLGRILLSAGLTRQTPLYGSQRTMSGELHTS